MKKEKKVYSLVTKEIWNAIIILLFIVAIILKHAIPQNTIGQLTVTIFIWAFIITYLGSTWVRVFVKFDIEDEAAIEHYNKAKGTIFDFLLGFCEGCGGVAALIILIAESKGYEITEKLSANINFWHVALVYSLIRLAVSACFIYYEKREA